MSSHIHIHEALIIIRKKSEKTRGYIFVWNMYYSSFSVYHSFKPVETDCTALDGHEQRLLINSRLLPSDRSYATKH